MKLEINKIRCQRCGHEWIPRISKILSCPKCHSYKWNEKRKKTLLKKDHKNDK